MNHQKIWDQLQSDDSIDAFGAALPRYKFLCDRIPSGVTALNIGVGHGGLEALLIKKGVEVSCLDPSETAISRIREKLQLGHRAKVGFSQAMPFNNDSFDAIFMTEVLEHLENDALDQTLKEVFRTLKPGGKFIGTVPANENLLDNHAICPHCGESFHRWGHVQSFTPADLLQQLKKHTLLIEKCDTRAFPDWTRMGIKNLVKNCARYVLGRSGETIAVPHIFFIAKKPVKNIQLSKPKMP
ncbi:class I SAM-dependent methyltransferase [Hydrogenophaga sp. OTU3427]|uniref:class I SAM-dependent methyltransferase n=1 Tax=Hydrogenophaga sp. OTU3427 TaxID=3043856 RepID=UPI00313D1C9B